MKGKRFISALLVALMLIFSFPVTNIAGVVAYAKSANVTAQSKNIGEVVGAHVLAGRTKVSIIWGSAKNASKYLILEYNTTTKKYKAIATTTKTNYCVEGLKLNKTYYFSVRGMSVVNGKNVYGPKSNLMKAKTSYIPRAVCGTKAISIGDTGAILKWHAIPQVTGYGVYRYNKSDKTYTYIGKTSKNYFKLSNLNPGTKYAYKVRAYNSVSNKTYKGGLSSFIIFTTTFSLGEVVGAHVLPGRTKVSILWGSAENATKYQIFEYDKTTKKYKHIATTTKTNYCVEGLKLNQTHYYVVRAVRVSGNLVKYSKNSNIMKATTSYTPRKVCGTKAINISDTAAVLKWHAIPQVTVYGIYRYNKSNKTYTYIGKTSKNYFKLSNLNSSTKYAYKVRAYNIVSDKTYKGGLSDFIIFTTKKAVSLTKTSITLAKGDSTTVLLKNSSIAAVASSNTAVAVVSKSGKIVAKSAGKANIVLADVYGNKHVCKVIVENPSINKTSIKINVQENYTLKLNNNTQKITWSSSNEKIATVSSKGVVTAKAVGTCTVTAKVASGAKFVCKVSVVKVTPVHVHTVITDAAVAPTCTETGLTAGSHCSVCGEVITAQEVVAALGHDFGEWTVTTKPTCTAKGEETRECSRCDATETREVAALGHDYVAVVTAPTCTEAGYTTYTCSRCADSYKDDEVAALGHTWDEGVVTTSATCTEDGVKTFTCSVCGETKTEAIPATGHKAVTDAAVAPTCTETGLTAGTHCSVCGEVITAQEVIAALGHDYVAVVTAPTCTEKGYTTYTCSRCADSYKDDEVAALGHDFGDWTVTTEPTCTAKGEETRECSRCDATETREVAALGHDYVAVVTAPTCTEKGYTTYTCSRCADSYKDDEVAALGHDFGDWTVTTEPTCTAKGEETRECSRCDATETREVAALGHDYVAVVTAPTCTEKGYTTYTCSRCADSYKDNEVAALGHDFGDWTVTTEPTCTAKGEETRECSRCDATETREVAALGHDYVAVVTAPTCTEKGYTTYTCSRCADSYKDDEVAALGHDFGDWAVTTEPTCTAKGEETRECSRCDATETREVAALGHDYVAVVTAPTCTEKGYTTYTCSRCADSYKDDEVAALGHDFGDWTVTTEPTCTAKGEETRECSRCDATETREVAALGHDYVAVVTAPTCTEKGYTTYTCSRCADSYKDDEVAALGHTWDEGTVTTEATCTEDGVKTFTCSVCGETKTESIPATGHTAAQAVKENIIDRKLTTKGSYDEVVYCSVCSEELSRTHYDADEAYLATVAEKSNELVEDKWAGIAEFNYDETNKVFSAEINSSAITSQTDVMKIAMSAKQYALNAIGYVKESAGKVDYVSVDKTSIYENDLFSNSGIKEVGLEIADGFFDKMSKVTAENNEIISLDIATDVGKGDEDFKVVVTVVGDKIEKAAEYAGKVADSVSFENEADVSTITVKVPEKIINKANTILESKGESIQSILTSDKDIRHLLMDLSAVDLNEHFDEDQLSKAQKLLDKYNENLDLANKALEKVVSLKISGVEVLSKNELTEINSVNDIINTINRNIITKEFGMMKVNSFVESDGTILLPVEIEYNVESSQYNLVGTVSEKINVVIDLSNAQ